MLAWRLLWRNWRSGEVKLLAVALLLSVTVVSAIALFTGALERTMMAQSAGLLGGDRIITSNREPLPEWMQGAAEREIEQTMVAHFGSMVFAGDEMHLASVKAVDEGYPLRGAVETSQIAFTMDESQIEKASQIPAPGEVWVDSRILPLLNIELGDTLQVGEKDFIATRVIIREPDGTSPFGLMGARIMLNWADLPATGVIQPGSRIEYHWLLAADEGPMERFVDWLEPSLSEHETILRVENAQRRLQGTLQTGRSFLVLAAIMGVLLSGVAIALAARQFAERHVNQVALLKSLG
ncbi:MAG TPA: ABC transporter permease, partial [Cellvibrionaceae bacterium]